MANGKKRSDIRNSYGSSSVRYSYCTSEGDLVLQAAEDRTFGLDARQFSYGCLIS